MRCKACCNLLPHSQGMFFVPEKTIPGGIRPDGVVYDEYQFRRGVWEAKDTQDDLDVEIRAKRKAFDYRLGSRSALEWTVDRYRVTIDKRTGIVNDPNQYSDDPRQRGNQAHLQ